MRSPVLRPALAAAAPPLLLALLVVLPRPALAQGSVTLYRYALSFHLEPPLGWTPQHDVGSLQLLLVAPSDGSSDSFRENVNVVEDGVPPGTTLDAYEEQSRSALASDVAEFAEVEAAVGVRLGGVPARRTVYEHIYGGRRLRVLAYCLVAGERAYVLTGTAPADGFDSYVGTFARVAESFRLE